MNWHTNVDVFLLDIQDVADKPDVSILLFSLDKRDVIWDLLLKAWMVWLPNNQICIYGPASADFGPFVGQRVAIRTHWCR